MKARLRNKLMKMQFSLMESEFTEIAERIGPELLIEAFHGRPMYYKLVGREIVPCGMMEWARGCEDLASRQIALTKIGPFAVSTIFLGLDHNFSRFGPAVLFETMAWTDMPDLSPNVLGLPERLHERLSRRTFEDLQERCCTYDEAIEQHKRIVVELKQPGDEEKDLLTSE